MAAEIRGDNINDVFLKSLGFLENHGSLLRIRGSEVREVTNFTYRLTNIHNNVLTIPYRNNNFAALCFETLWVLSGRNDLKYLKYFLPNCGDYSDSIPGTFDFNPQGGIWGGAYGTRLRYGNNQNWRWNFHDKNVPHIIIGDQIFNVIRTLEKDLFSRQAIIIIGTSSDYDFDLDTKDRPCNVSLQFLVRNNKLDCTIFQRSGDAIWGAFNINIFEWTTLMKIIADCLNIPTGTLTHHITSFHYYIEQHEKTVENILTNKDDMPDIYRYFNIEPYLREHELDDDYHKMLEFHYANISHSMSMIEDLIENKHDTESDSMFVDNDNNHYTINLFEMARAFILMKKGNNVNRLMGLINAYVDNDLYLAAMLEYMVRYYKKNDGDKLPELITLIYEKFKDKPAVIDFITWSI